MPISGYVAGGASEALEEVLDRRLKEQIRQQQEKEHADQVAIQRQQIDLQQKRDAAMDLERAEDRKWRQGERDIATAQRAEADTDPGAITPEIAAVLSKDPAIAGRISQRKVIDASPIAAQSVLPGTVAPEAAGGVTEPSLMAPRGPRMIESLSPRMPSPTAMGGAVTAGVDASGPQQYPVLGATPKQADAAKLKTDTASYYDELARASGEDAKREVAARAGRVGVKLDPSLIAPSESEKRTTDLQTRMAQEQRELDRWLQQNTITSGQADARQNRSDQLIRERAEINREEKPPTEAAKKLAGYTARMEQAETILAKLEPEIIKMSPASFYAQVWTDKPMFQSAIIQQYMQAARNLNIAKLRDESGAVISPTEFAEATEQYLPIPGNDPKTLEQKRQNRALNHTMYKRASGKAYISVDDALKEADGGGKGDTIPKVVKNPKTGKWEVEK